VVGHAPILMKWRMHTRGEVSISQSAKTVSEVQISIVTMKDINSQVVVVLVVMERESDVLAL